LNSDYQGVGEIYVEVDGVRSNSLFILEADRDNDGLSAEEEAAAGSDPNRPDSDFDGVSDIDEIRNRTNPSNADTDGDGKSVLVQLLLDLMMSMATRYQTSPSVRQVINSPENVTKPLDGCEFIQVQQAFVLTN